MREYHHVFGRSNSPVKIRLCFNDHRLVSQRQNELPRYIKKRTAPRKCHWVFILRSIGTLLEIIGRELGKISDEMMEDMR